MGNGDHADEQMVLKGAIGGVDRRGAFRGRPTLRPVQALPGLWRMRLDPIWKVRIAVVELRMMGPIILLICGPWSIEILEIVDRGCKPFG